MGFGHRVYKNFDRAPRSSDGRRRGVRGHGKNRLLDIARLEKIALEDDYFTSRKLYPNVDFYSGLIYEALGMPVEMFPVLFAIDVQRWIASGSRYRRPGAEIARPRQIYTGERGSIYVPMPSADARFCDMPHVCGAAH